MEAVVVGGSAAGLVTALMLARAGHEVELVDRDELQPAADAEAAAKTALRPAAPQLVHPHAYQPLARRILRDRLPDVYAALLDAGAEESSITDRMPPTLADRSAGPGDEQLTTLLARRSTLDWVLQSAAAAQPGLRLTGRARVAGLLASDYDPPRVLGVRTERGEHPGDIVIDASGRRSAVDQWLAGIGARTSETVFAECGAAYYTRHYRMRPGAPRPGPGRLALVGFLPFFTVAAFTGDNDTVTVALAPLVEDLPLKALRHPAAHDGVARMIRPVAKWLEVCHPASEVFAMGGLHNTLRRLVVDHRPVALGLHAVGDAVCTTNPTFGRGLSLAMQGAVDLVAVLAEHPDDPWAQAHAMDAAVTAQIAPWYADQAAADSARLASIRRALRGEPPVPLPDLAGGVTPAHLVAAAMVDPDLYRVFASLIGMLRRPSDVYGDPDTAARVRAVCAAADVSPPGLGPSRADLLAALG